MAKHVVRVEKVRGRRYFVARDARGRFAGRKAVKGSSYTLDVARMTWAEHGSFTIGKYYKKEYLGKNKLTSRSYHLAKPTLEQKKSDLGTSSTLDRYFTQPQTTQKRFSQYQCQGVYKKVLCIGSSDRLYYNGVYGVKEAVADARSRFWRRVAAVHKDVTSKATDPDEALGRQQEDHVTDYKEGWVSYAPNVKTN